MLFVLVVLWSFVFGVGGGMDDVGGGGWCVVCYKFCGGTTAIRLNGAKRQEDYYCNDAEEDTVVAVVCHYYAGLTD